MALLFYSTFNKKSTCRCGRNQVKKAKEIKLISTLDEITFEAGLKVQIHSQDEPPFIHELGFGISPGRQTLVSTQVFNFLVFSTFNFT